jgi:PKD repeat protein
VSPAGAALLSATAMTFVASASGSGVSYTWDFGDGSTGTGVSVSHVYTNEGTFTVSLTASNPAGQVSTTTSVVVRSLSGNWDYSLSSGFQSLVNVIQSGANFSGSANGFTLTGSVADPRVVSFVVQAGSCTETMTGGSDAPLNVISGNVLSCTGQSSALVMTRQ